MRQLGALCSSAATANNPNISQYTSMAPDWPESVLAATLDRPADDIAAKADWRYGKLMAKSDQQMSARPRSALFLATDLSSGGGVNKVIRDLSEIFADDLGFSVTVVNARSEASPSYPFPSSVDVQHHERGGLMAYLRVLRGLRRSRPDFVIGPWAQDNILLILAFLFTRTKVVAMEHTSWDFHPPLIRLVRRLFYPLAWRVVVLNPAELRHYSRQLSNVELMPNPISPSSATAPGTREKLILAVGHLEERKNFMDAIEAMARSGLERDGWSLAIVGSGPEQAKLNEQIGRLGLKRTSIHPPTDGLSSWYGRASLTLVTAKLEVFSLVLAEAMAAGVVPIAYSTDGPAFLLEDFPEHLVNIGDVNALAARLSHFAKADDLTILRDALAKSIEARFSPSVIAGRWRALLSGGSSD